MSDRRFFKCDDIGPWWVGVATDRDQFIAMLRECGDQWYEADDSTVECGIDAALAAGTVEITEFTTDELATKHRRCHTDDRGVIPLTDGRIGDLFCSEW
jgi:hypothetical protein